MSTLAIVATAIASLMIAFSGVMKLMGPPRIIEGLTKYGVARHRRLLGLMELVFVALFVFPPTMKIGFLLGSCYFAGAMGAELAHGALTVAPAIPLALLWIAAFLRNSSLFLPS